MTTVIDVIINTSQELLDKIKNVQQSAREEHKEKKEAEKEKEKATIEAAIAASKEESDAAINDPRLKDDVYAKRQSNSRYIDIAVVDEASVYNVNENEDGPTILNGDQTTYRNNNPANTFILLQPLDTQDTNAGPLPLPIEFYGPVPPLTGPDAPPPPPAFYEVVARPGDGQGNTNWITLIESLVGSLSPSDKIRISIDNSGSMTIDTVYDDYTQFLNYLEEAEIDFWVTIMTDERWLYDFRESAEEFWLEQEAE